MTESIHGHEVMHFMLEQGGSFTKESLRQAVEQRGIFGTLQAELLVRGFKLIRKMRNLLL